MEDDPIDELDRDLGIATKLVALPLLIDMFLSLLLGLLRGGCTVVLFVGFVLVLLGVSYPWVSLSVLLLLLIAAIRYAWLRAQERPRGPRRGGTGH